jgi:hypothetical protein
MSRDPESHKGTIKAIHDSFKLEEEQRDLDYEAVVNRLIKNLDSFAGSDPKKEKPDGSAN